MYQLSVKSKFSAAHTLCGYPGDCARLHGHTWTVEVKVAGPELDHLGMLVDFKAIKKELSNIVDQFDHRLLNEITPFAEGDLNPTAENLACYIFKSLKKSVNALGSGIGLKEVSVWESQDAYATYWEEYS